MIGTGQYSDESSKFSKSTSGTTDKLKNSLNPTLSSCLSEIRFLKTI